MHVVELSNIKINCRIYSQTEHFGKFKTLFLELKVSFFRAGSVHGKYPNIRIIPKLNNSIQKIIRCKDAKYDEY